MTNDIQYWVRKFVEGIINQSDAIWQKHDAELGNKYATQVTEAFQSLRSMGNIGRESLLPMLMHERNDVRVTVATYLLRFRTDLALAVLREESKGKGWMSFEAGEAIKRWEEGNWHLDPEE